MLIDIKPLLVEINEYNPFKWLLINNCETVMDERYKKTGQVDIEVKINGVEVNAELLFKIINEAYSRIQEKEDNYRELIKTATILSEILKDIEDATN